MASASGCAGSHPNVTSCNVFTCVLRAQAAREWCSRLPACSSCCRTARCRTSLRTQYGHELQSVIGVLAPHVLEMCEWVRASVRRVTRSRRWIYVLPSLLRPPSLGLWLGRQSIQRRRSSCQRCCRRGHPRQYVAQSCALCEEVYGVCVADGNRFLATDDVVAILQADGGAFAARNPFSFELEFPDGQLEVSVPSAAVLISILGCIRS
jgi:hypothetical protein